MNKLRFLDPLYGVLHCSKSERDLLLSPELQRLRYIRMCNINSLQISGASETSRFEHCVGVYALAKHWVKTHHISKNDGDDIVAASILHDMQTGPFGHSLEYIFTEYEKGVDFSHEDIDVGNKKMFWQSISHAASFCGVPFTSIELLGSRRWSIVSKMIKGEGKYGRLISCDIDIDNIDNVFRLAYHVGLVERHKASATAMDLVADLEIGPEGLSISSAGIELVNQWYSVRHDLYTYLLHDRAEFSAKAMLTQIMEDSIEAGLLGADSWIYTDDSLASHLLSVTVGENQNIAHLVKRWLSGDLYEPAFVVRIDGTEMYSALSDIGFKRKIEKIGSSVFGSKCIFHVIKDKNKTDRRVTIYDRDINDYIEIGNSTDETLFGMFVSIDSVPEGASVQIIKEIEGMLGISADSMRSVVDPLDNDKISDAPGVQMSLIDE